MGTVVFDKWQAMLGCDWNDLLMFALAVVLTV